MPEVLQRSHSLHINTEHTNEEGNFFMKATKMLSTSLGITPEFHRSKSWGCTITKKKFNDMDLLENGLAREYISEECLSPTLNEKRWTNCFVQRTQKSQYRLYEDSTGRFLMSAKQVGDTFYISQYEDYPEDDYEAQDGYCAVLRRTPNTTNFKLYSCGCECCDKSYMKYTCDDNMDHDTASADRQLLADITQATKNIKHVDADMRCISVTIPAVMPDKRSRVVWCPRICGSDTPSGATPRRNQKRDFVTSPSPTLKPHQSFDSDSEFINDRVHLESKLPEWNQELRSLVLKFHGGRVLAASSKNFLLTDVKDTSRGILQFGKSRKGRFVLDFRHPIAPIQAFALCLSACAWKAE